MTSTTSPAPDPASERMRTAVAELRERSTHRAVEIASDVLAQAMLGQRRSQPVRAHAPFDFVRVGDRVIVAALSQRIDAGLANAAVGQIALQISRSDELEAITIELYVRYGEVLLDIADRARHIADEVVADLLNIDSGRLTIRITHIHISNITTGDPQLVDPLDE